MAGLSDGVSKLWILRKDRSLNIDGYKTEAEAIAHLVRFALVFAADADRETIRDQIREAFEQAMAPDSEDEATDE